MSTDTSSILSDIEAAIRGGLRSRSELSMAAGITRTRFDTVASAGIRAKRLRMLPDRDRWGGMQFDLTQQPSEPIVAEVCV